MRKPPTNYGAAVDLYTMLSLHDELWSRVDVLRHTAEKDKSLSKAGVGKLLARADELAMFADRIREHLGSRIYFNEEQGRWKENKRWKIRKRCR